MPESYQLSGQGTRRSAKAPWQTYDNEMTEKLDPQLEQEVADYGMHRHERTSSQNEEELCRQKEANQEIAKEYQWLTPEEYAHIEPRIGRVMHSDHLITRLRRECGLRCWYRQHPQAGKLTLVYGDSLGMKEPEVGCWVQAGNMPEYSIMRFDDHGIPLDERRRGWRTCLLQLILKGVLSEETVDRVFGHACGPASDRYLRTVREFRNRTSEWAA